MKILKRVLKILLIVLISLFAVILVANIVKRVMFSEFYSTARSEGAVPGIADGFVQQGLDAYDGGFLVSGYMADKSNSRIYYTKDGETSYTVLTKADGSKFTGHSGGISHSGDYLYIGGSKGVYVFSLADIFDGDGKAAQLGFVRTFLNAAWSEVYDGKLIVGSFWYEPEGYTTSEWQEVTTPAGDENHSMITVFELDENAEFGVNPAPVCVYSTNMKVQGAAFCERGIILSTSIALQPSEFRFYKTEGLTQDRITLTDGEESYADLPLYYLDSSNHTHTVTAFPMAEEIVIKDGRVYVMNESASNKYIYGKLFGMDNFYSFELRDEYFE